MAREGSGCGVFTTGPVQQTKRNASAKTTVVVVLDGDFRL